MEGEVTGVVEQASGVEMMRDLLASYARAPEVAKVAVVGNAPLEPDDERADDIDSADLVLRVNSFVLDRPGEPRTQGSRVDVVMFNRNLVTTPFTFDRYRERLYILSQASHLFHERGIHRHLRTWPSWWPEDLGAVVLPNDDFTAPLLDELGVPWRETTVIPTTGTLAVFTARTCFPDADLLITGFSIVDDPQQTEWKHQWGDTSPIGGTHLIAAESSMLTRWLSTGKVRMRR